MSYLSTGRGKLSPGGGAGVVHGEGIGKAVGGVQVPDHGVEGRCKSGVDVREHRRLLQLGGKELDDVAEWAVRGQLRVEVGWGRVGVKGAEGRKEVS